MSELRVQYFAVNLHQSVATKEATAEDLNQFLLLDVALNGGDWSYQRCLYQVDLSPHSSRVVKNWACGWETIVQMCRVLLDSGNIDSVYNATAEMVDILKAKDENNVPMLRVMLNCDQGASGRREITHLSAVLFNASKHTTLEEIAGRDKVTTPKLVTTTAREVNTTATEATTASIKVDGEGETSPFNSTALVRVKRSPDNSSLPPALSTSIVGSSFEMTNYTTSNYTVHFSNVGKPLGVIVLVVVAITVILIIYVYWFDNGPYKERARRSKDPLAASNVSNVSQIRESATKQGEVVKAQAGPPPPAVAQVEGAAGKGNAV